MYVFLIAYNILSLVFVTPRKWCISSLLIN